MSILDLIDNVLADEGGDAMRWAPDQPEPTAFNPDTSRFRIYLTFGDLEQDNALTNRLVVAFQRTFVAFEEFNRRFAMRPVLRRMHSEYHRRRR